MERLPRRILMVGGGYLAAEFSHIAARAGAEVTVLQRADRMLTQFDPDLVGWLIRRFEGTRHHHSNRHLAGRPALQPGGYAAGDAAQVGPPLTPVAGLDGRVAAANLLDGNPHKRDYCGIPSVALTIPPIASVGLTEQQALERGLAFRTNCAFVPQWATARRLGETVYGYKVLVETATERILGAHLVGPEADEIINLFALAVRHELTTTALKSTLFAYPTAASDIQHML